MCIRDSLESATDTIRIFVDSLDGILPKIVEITGGRLHDVSINEASLENVFIQLTGRDLRE